MPSTVDSLCDKGQELVAAGVTPSDPQFNAWKAQVKRYLIKTYGPDSYEVTDFDKIKFGLTVFMTNVSVGR